MKYKSLKSDNLRDIKDFYILVSFFDPYYQNVFFWIAVDFVVNKVSRQPAAEIRWALLSGGQLSMAK